MKDYEILVSKKIKLRQALKTIIRYMRDENKKIKNLELLLKIRRLEGTLKKDLTDLLDKMDSYIDKIDRFVF
jgi:hypothetical protein